MNDLPDITNFRDLGGTPTADGRVIAPRKLYRCAALDRCTREEAILLADEYDVGTVIDLRSTLERRRHPDTYIPGAHYIALPLVPAKAMSVALEGDNLMEMLRGTWDPDTYDVCVTYRSMLDPAVVPRWRALFRALLKSDGRAVLWHCTNGKDRTGVVAAIVLIALGVPDATVRADYLESNERLAARRAEILNTLAEKGERPGIGEKVGPLLEARPEYLNAALDAIDDNYGGQAAFFEDVCQLSIAEDEQLHRLFLQSA